MAFVGLDASVIAVFLSRVAIFSIIPAKAGAFPAGFCIPQTRAKQVLFCLFSSVRRSRIQRISRRDQRMFKEFVCACIYAYLGIECKAKREYCKGGMFDLERYTNIRKRFE